MSDESQSSPDTPSNIPEPWQPRFGIGGMMLVMLVFCVVAAGASYLVSGLQGSRDKQLIFILFTLAGPVLLLIAVSLIYKLIARINGKR